MANPLDLIIYGGLGYAAYYVYRYKRLPPWLEDLFPKPVTDPTGCPSGTTWDAASRSCKTNPTPQSCPSGMVWSPEANNCVGTCPAGQAWDPEFKTCVTSIFYPPGTPKPKTQPPQPPPEEQKPPGTVAPPPVVGPCPDMLVIGVTAAGISMALPSLRTLGYAPIQMTPNAYRIMLRNPGPATAAQNQEIMMIESLPGLTSSNLTCSH